MPIAYRMAEFATLARAGSGSIDGVTATGTSMNTIKTGYRPVAGLFGSREISLPETAGNDVGELDAQVPVRDVAGRLVDEDLGDPANLGQDAGQRALLLLGMRSPVSRVGDEVSG